MMMIKQLVLADQIQVEATCGAHRKYYQSKLDQVWISSILLTCTTYCLHLNLIHLHLTHCYGPNDVNLITGIVPIFVRRRINTLKIKKNKKRILVEMERKHAASSYISSSAGVNKRCSYLPQQQRVRAHITAKQQLQRLISSAPTRATNEHKTSATAMVFPSSVWMHRRSLHQLSR